MSKPLSDIYQPRIEMMLKNALGRDLTREERKYLGLSAIAVPPDEGESLFGSPEAERRKNGSRFD